MWRVQLCSSRRLYKDKLQDELEAEGWALCVNIHDARNSLRIHTTCCANCTEIAITRSGRVQMCKMLGIVMHVIYGMVIQL